MKYCESIFETKRRPTRTVMVGGVAVGSDHPIRMQSMTTSSTHDVSATIDQAMRLADAGCEIVRVTVQGMREARACEQIKNGLVQRGYQVPLVADIHFYPPAALEAVEFVDKVRINPGNFVDRRASFKVIEYTDATYQKEIEKIEQKFTPLVEKCKRLKRAMRIGTNHGSLSDRIMNRYGDTPEGMVESAVEFARICRAHDFHDLIFSMKSSNPQVMILAYRLLAAKMYELGWDYPLHLGVTEAGEGEDGRIKSAMGIGSLLLDGIGDTIRVSLTEDPWHEIDPCKRLVQLAAKERGCASFEEKYRDFRNIEKRKVVFPTHLGLHKQGTVSLNIEPMEAQDPSFYKAIGCESKLERTSVDSLVLRSKDQLLKETLHERGVGILEPRTIDEALQQKVGSQFSLKQAGHGDVICVEGGDPAIWGALKELNVALILLRPKAEQRVHFSRRFFDWLKESQIEVPVLLNFVYSCSKEELIIEASAECGALLCDGLADGLCLEGPYELSFLREFSFNILQAARRRLIKTDFISCPSCGRTLFDLQEVTKRIRSRTSHLVGVKIAIMGCIVNGPGEMADADFGYVGSRPGKIDLYVGKECVEKNIDFAESDERLVALIRSHGRWQDIE